jgi:cytochrome c biogenesis protein CcmG/thiol:disulfide interchange protein DsbE
MASGAESKAGGNRNVGGRVEAKDLRRTPLKRFPLVGLGILLLAAVLTAQRLTRAEMRARTDRTAAPSLRLVNATGNVVRLSDFRGRPLVLNFWATECGGCKVELPTFVNLARKYKKEGLTVAGVSMDIMYSDLKDAAAGWSQVKAFLRTHRLDYPIVLDDGSGEKAFNVTATPATYLIDRTGRVAATYIGVVEPKDIETNIRALLAER